MLRPKRSKVVLLLGARMAICLSQRTKCRHAMPKAASVPLATPESPSYLVAGSALPASRAIAQTKPASSRATAVMATVLSLPLLMSAR